MGRARSRANRVLDRGPGEAVDQQPGADRHGDHHPEIEEERTAAEAPGHQPDRGQIGGGSDEQEEERGEEIVEERSEAELQRAASTGDEEVFARFESAIRPACGERVSLLVALRMSMTAGMRLGTGEPRFGRCAPDGGARAEHEGDEAGGNAVSIATIGRTRAIVPPNSPQVRAIDSMLASGVEIRNARVELRPALF